MALNKLTCPFPANINPLSSGGFKLTIQKAPNVQFWCNEANLPGMSISAATQATPFSIVKTPGETIDYDTLNIQFLIDANMENYYEIWNWIYGIGFPENNDDFQNFIDADNRGIRGTAARLVSDATLAVLNNSFNPIRNIQFIDLWPTSINSLQLQATNSDTIYLAGQATFNFSHWKFVD